MNKRLRRQVEAHQRDQKARADRAAFSRFVYHTAKARGVNPEQLRQIDPARDPE